MSGSANRLLREATIEDIAALHALRVAVRENRLRDATRVTPADYCRYLANPGSSWLVESAGEIQGFGIADPSSRSIWALFVAPDCQGQGIGRQLLLQVTDYLRAQSSAPMHLSTEPGTRALRMYLAAGWVKRGVLENGEVWLTR